MLLVRVLLGDPKLARGERASHQRDSARQRDAAPGVEAEFDRVCRPQTPPLLTLGKLGRRYGCRTPMAANLFRLVRWGLTRGPTELELTDDEPDGRRYPPAWVHAASALIRSLDTTRPISMCFDTTQRPGGTWPLYVNATDVVLADIYPVVGIEQKMSSPI